MEKLPLYVLVIAAVLPLLISAMPFFGDTDDLADKQNFDDADLFKGKKFYIAFNYHDLSINVTFKYPALGHRLRRISRLG